MFVQSSMDLVADVNGYIPAGSSYRPVVPERLLDTRSGPKPADGSTIELSIVRVVTVWPCGTARPTASNLDLVSGGISPNLVIAKLGVGGKDCIYTQAAAHLVADVNGSWPCTSRNVPTNAPPIALRFQRSLQDQGVDHGAPRRWPRSRPTPRWRSVLASWRFGSGA